MRTTALPIVLMLMTSSLHSASAEQPCKLVGSIYELIDDPTFRLVFEPENEAVGFAIALYHERAKFFSGKIWTSNGWPVNSIEAKDLKGELTVTFLDSELKSEGEPDEDKAAAYLVIPSLTPAIYYADPNREPKHFPVGAVWKLKGCGDSNLNRVREGLN